MPTCPQAWPANQQAHVKHRKAALQMSKDNKFTPAWVQKEGVLAFSGPTCKHGGFQ
uniref:Uncharacterized protein n=1 Tax=Magnetococcus massalia (strain MO-1) TaxID=451514 RepID=A0A1S7LJZ6_MAGMO|nr:protein of unknown function [Candidatus Magnetococcus massalia]